MSEFDCPPHNCEFFTNPEKGACDFHERWADLRAQGIPGITAIIPTEKGPERESGDFDGPEGIKFQRKRQKDLQDKIRKLRKEGL